MKHGLKGVKCGFIGEIVVKEVDTDQTLIEQVCKFVDQTGCPAYFNVGCNQAAVNQIVKYSSSSKIVFIVSQFSEDFFSYILEKTQATVCLTIYDFGLSNPSYKQDPTFFLHEKAQFLTKIFPSYGSRVIVSSYCSFLSHTTQYGGTGYSAIKQVLTPEMEYKFS